MSKSNFTGCTWSKRFTNITPDSSRPIRGHQLLQRWLASFSVVTGHRYVYSRKLLRSSSAAFEFYGRTLRTGDKKQTQWHKRTPGTIQVKHKTCPFEQVKMVLDTISRIIKHQLPAYLKRLPLPETIGGFARLTGNQLEPCCTSDFPVKMTSKVRWGHFSGQGSLLLLVCRRQLKL